jgi:hypothetical protein
LLQCTDILNLSLQGAYRRLGIVFGVVDPERPRSALFYVRTYQPSERMENRYTVDLIIEYKMRTACDVALSFGLGLRGCFV